MSGPSSVVAVWVVTAARTGCVPLTVRPSAEMRPSRNEMTGNRAVSRNLADRTLWLRIGFGVLKLAVSISAWMAESVSGSAMYAVADRIANGARGGAEPEDG